MPAQRSDPARQPDPAVGTAVLAALAWIATVVGVNGFVSVATGLEVVPLHRAGPLAEPVGVAIAAALLAWRMRRDATAGRMPVECVLIAYLAMIVLGAAVAGFSGGGGAAVLFAGDAALSPFTIADAVLAGIAGLVVLLIARARRAGAGRPRWPWEGDGDP